MKTIKAAGGPSWCWHCQKQLHRAPGKGRGLFFFNIVLGRDGYEHRVHGACVAAAQADGAKLVPQPAQ